MEYLLFSNDSRYAGAASRAGFSAIVVDWEWRGKADRQRGFDTEINLGGLDALRAVREAVSCKVICRVNNARDSLEAEVELAIDNGANEILLPMVRHPAEVEALLTRIDGRAHLGVMVETREGMGMGRELEPFPLSRVYIGLHDYQIESQGHTLFSPLVDGTIDRFLADFRGALGFAGITRPACGAPIPQWMLLAAMHRAGCQFGVARRGFRSAVESSQIAEALAELDAASQALQSRTSDQIEADHRKLKAMVHGLPCTSPSLDVEHSTCAS